MSAPLPAELVGWWTRLPPHAGATRVLALDGRSGSGKTLLAATLSTLAPSAAVVHLDDVYPGWDGLDQVVPRVLDSLLRPLATGDPAGYRQWDWTRDADGAWQPVPTARLLLLEGVGSGARAFAPYLSGLVWLDAAEPLRKRRALARDGQAFAPHWQRWSRQEEIYLRRNSPDRRADVILDGGHDLRILVDRRDADRGKPG